MKNLSVVLLAVGLNLMPVLVQAQEPTVAQAPVPVEVGNKICPVSGDKVGDMGEVVKQEYKGRIYNLCCGMCSEDFNKDSEKYSKIAEDEVKANHVSDVKE